MSAEKFFTHIDLLRCPACGTAFSQQDRALVCKNGHTFDPSKKGYVHFLPNARPSKYDAALSEARRRILEGGFYDAVIENECMMCLKDGKEINKCKIREALLEVGPPTEIIEDGIGCEYRDVPGQLIRGEIVTV